jgi:hypothetical protein
MAQASTQERVIGAVTAGSISECQRCGGSLTLRDGTDPQQAHNGFVETYECDRCNREGKYQYDAQSGQEYYQGVCADYGHNDV